MANLNHADTTQPPLRQSVTAHKLPVNVDALAIGIALTLAALIRLGVIHQITF
jgi:hypothetical protein